MISHIYGWANALTRPGRPPVLLREFELCLEVFGEDLAVLDTAVESRSRAQLQKILEGLAMGEVARPTPNRRSGWTRSV